MRFLKTTALICAATLAGSTLLVPMTAQAENYQKDWKKGDGKGDNNNKKWSKNDKWDKKKGKWDNDDHHHNDGHHHNGVNGAAVGIGIGLGVLGAAAAAAAHDRDCWKEERYGRIVTVCD